jgi:hypothetical protein
MTLETMHVAAYTGRKASDFTPELPAMEGLKATFSGPGQRQSPWIITGGSETGPGARMHWKRKKPAQDLQISLREEES